MRLPILTIILIAQLSTFNASSAHIGAAWSCIHTVKWCPRQAGQLGADLWLRNDERSQAVVANSSRNRKHAHHPHAVPEQDLAARRFNASLV